MKWVEVDKYKSGSLPPQQDASKPISGLTGLCVYLLFPSQINIICPPKHPDCHLKTRATFLTFVLDCTASLHMRHFLTRDEHKEHVATWPQGPNSISRFMSEQTMHSSSPSFSSSSTNEVRFELFFCEPLSEQAKRMTGFVELRRVKRVVVSGFD